MAKRKTRTVRRGGLPGEYTKRSLVTIPAGLEAAMIDPVDGPKRDLHYVVTTRRFDLLFKVEIEFKGQLFLLPHRVVGQIVRQMESIKTQQRRDSAVQRAQMIAEKGSGNQAAT